jgi:hypothetical protein
VAELPLPVSVQLELLNVPAPLLLKPTVPVGVLLVPTSVSLTVAVQVVDCPTTTDAGLQLTLVPVERLLTVTMVVPELTAWVVSPP